MTYTLVQVIFSRIINFKLHFNWILDFVTICGIYNCKINWFCKNSFSIFFILFTKIFEWILKITIAGYPTIFPEKSVNESEVNRITCFPNIPQYPYKHHTAPEAHHPPGKSPKRWHPLEPPHPESDALVHKSSRHEYMQNAEATDEGNSGVSTAVGWLQ